MNWLIKYRNIRTAPAILAITHLVGVAGLNIATFAPFFEKLTAVNLLISFTLVLIFEPLLSTRLALICIAVFIISMAVEILGVNTGFPFGRYHYTNRLGPGLAGVPLVIGLNWILLSYTSAVLIRPQIRPKYIRIGFGAGLMVLLDLLLEGFAVRHNLWVWNDGVPPLCNYLSWLLVSVVLMFFWETPEHKPNPVAGYYLVILIVFLVVDRLINL